LAQLALAAPARQTPKSAMGTDADGRESASDARTPASDASRGDAIRRAWQQALSRPPSEDELRIAAEFVAEQSRNYSGPNAGREALADLCQMLLSSNSFLYLE
ncbi:MAG TPA: hypothetical protein PLV92_17300, partial [Pirellulaceae bacterium]|nr:hypothetical protein [Pirellulaceae bacterium]